MPLSCGEGTADCNGDLADGCETRLTSAGRCGPRSDTSPPGSNCTASGGYWSAGLFGAAGWRRRRRQELARREARV